MIKKCPLLLCQRPTITHTHQLKRLEGSKSLIDVMKRGTVSEIFVVRQCLTAKTVIYSLGAQTVSLSISSQAK